MKCGVPGFERQLCLEPMPGELLVLAVGGLGTPKRTRQQPNFIVATLSWNCRITGTSQNLRSERRPHQRQKRHQ